MDAPEVEAKPARPRGRDGEARNLMTRPIEAIVDHAGRPLEQSPIEHVKFPFWEAHHGLFIFLAREGRVLQRIEVDHLDFGMIPVGVFPLILYFLFQPAE